MLFYKKTEIPFPFAKLVKIYSRAKRKTILLVPPAYTIGTFTDKLGRGPLLTRKKRRHTPRYTCGQISNNLYTSDYSAAFAAIAWLAVIATIL